MSGLVESDPGEVLDSLDFSSLSGLSINGDVPRGVVKRVELRLALPFHLFQNSFSASPVTDHVFVSRIEQNRDITLKSVNDILGGISHGIVSKSSVDSEGSLSPILLGAKESLDLFVVEENSCLTEIIIVFHSDVVNIVLTLDEKSEHKVALNLSNKPEEVDLVESYTESVTDAHQSTIGVSGKFVLKSEIDIVTVLDGRVNPTVSNGNTSEVDILMGVLDDVR